MVTHVEIYPLLHHHPLPRPYFFSLQQSARINPVFDLVVLLVLFRLEPAEQQKKENTVAERNYFVYNELS